MFDDLKAIYRNDPAARGLQPVLYPGLHAIICMTRLPTAR